VAPPDPFGLVGQVLDGQFRVDRFIGEGGFSVVYAGHHLGLSEPIAIKCMKLPPQLSSQLIETFVQRFRDESRLHYKLSQGNLYIARTMAAGTTVSPVTRALVPYMVLEWLDGHSLASELERDPRQRPLSEVVPLFDTAVDALSFAQSQGVVHRDLNPGNFFLTKTASGTKLKVLDFGVAKVLDESRLEIGPRVQTMGKIRIFAPAYGAPEQFDDTLGPIGPATDVYALALVVLEALSGKTVMTGEHLGDFAMAALDPVKRPSPKGVGVVVSPDVESVFARALAVSPRDRWPTVRDFWTALRLASRLGGAAEAGRGPETMLLATMPLDGGAQDDPTTVDVLPEEPSPATQRLGAANLASAVSVPSGQGAPAAPPVVPSADPLASTVAPVASLADPLASTASPLGASAGPVVSLADPLASTASPLGKAPNPLAATVALAAPIAVEKAPPSPAPAPPKGDRSQLVTLAMTTRPSLPGDERISALPPSPPVPAKPGPGLSSTVVMAELPLPPRERPSFVPDGRVSSVPHGAPPPPDPGGMGHERVSAIPGERVSAIPGERVSAVPGAPPARPAFAPDDSPVSAPTTRGSYVGLGVAAAVVVLVVGGLGLYAVFGRGAPTPAPPSASVAPPPAPSTSSADAPPPSASSSPTPAPAPSASSSAAAEAPPSATPEPPPSPATPSPVSPSAAVPTKPPSTAPTPQPTPQPSTPATPGMFDRALAQKRLDQANGVLVACKAADGPNGKGSASVTFAPSGAVTAVGLTVPFEGTKVGACVRGQFLRVKTTPYVGGPETMAYVFTVPK